jgi:uncharacterized protein (DUF433 family)
MMAIQERTMKERIAVDPRIHFGKPCVAGTRIPVQNVLELVREEIPFAEIIRDYYPELKSEDIRASLACFRPRSIPGRRPMGPD